MHRNFNDITDRAGKPDWFDQNGVPRYGEFSPEAISGFYADHAALLEIQCQNCQQDFHVAVHCHRGHVEYNRRIWEVAYEAHQGQLPEVHPRTGFHRDDEGYQRIRFPSPGDVGWFMYGDPPRHENLEWYNDCLAGDTMTAIPVQVLEFWIKENSQWVRHPEYEVDVWPKWADIEIPDSW